MFFSVIYTEFNTFQLYLRFYQSFCNVCFIFLFQLIHMYFHLFANVFTFKLQGDQKKKHANWSFLGEMIQPKLRKFTYNLIRGRRVRI